MKKLSILFILLISKFAISQQSFSSNFINDVKKPYRDAQMYQSYTSTIAWLKMYGDTAKKDSIKYYTNEKRKYQKWYRRSLQLDLPVFGISGLGNLNQESLASLNA